MSAAARRRLLAFDWPGNVRQLRNVIESMVVVDYDGVLDLDDLPERTGRRRPTSRRPAAAADLAGLVGKPLAEIERLFIAETLEIDRRQSRERGRDAGHRPADAVSQDQGIQSVGAEDSRHRDSGRCRRRAERLVIARDGSLALSLIDVAILEPR